MKKALILLLTALLIITMVACSSEEENELVGTWVDKDNDTLIFAYFGNIRTLISGLSGQRIGIIRTAYRNYPDSISETSGHLVELTN